MILIDFLSKNHIELTGAILTLICVWLNAKGKALGWLFSILGTSYYIYIFYKAFLVGDFLLNIYFLLISIYGWYNWLYGDKSKTQLPITQLKRSTFIALIPLGAVCSVLLGYAFSFYPNAAVPYWDAVVTAFSVIAQWLMAEKKLDNWLLWVGVNINALAIYFYKQLYITSVLYFILLILAFKGYYEWKKQLLNYESKPL